MALATDLAEELRPGDRLLLEGELGAGKSTFARAVIRALGVEQSPEGSPTFAIAHEYPCRGGRIAHVDFYRLEREEEIADAGIEEFFWDPNRITIAEWTSRMPGFVRELQRPVAGLRTWMVSLSVVSPELRRIEIQAP